MARLEVPVIDGRHNSAGLGTVNVQPTFHHKTLECFAA